MRELHAAVSETWGDYRFSVLATAEDYIVIRFSLASVGAANRRGISAFMETLVRTCFTVDAYRLTKVVEEWGRVVVPVAGEDGGAVEEGEEAGFLYYALRCPWSRSSKLA